MGSIVNRLNAALVWRKFLHAVIIDVVLALIVVATWCLTIESTCGGTVTNVSGRHFAGYELADENLGRIIDDISAKNSVDYTSRLIFAGTTYRFLIGGKIYNNDASVILSTTVYAVAAILLFQIAAFFVQQFTGRGFIKRYLRPIDEVAMSAERISAAAASHPESDEVLSLASAINEIDDSGKRVAVHDSELGGLEAALNNMLRRLEESKRKQIRFVDDASHELRTPIAVIQGYVNMLDRWGKDDPKVMEESIEAIKNESEHMKTLIDQLLFLARGDMERHVLEMLPVDANELLSQVTEESGMIDGGHRYFFEPECDGRDVTVEADPAMIKQVLRILTDNASKYTPENGDIRFRAYNRDGSVCLEVSDSGIGIPPDEVPRIFDRFYRGQAHRSDAASGSGLGLSIAKWIVDRHNGKIEVISSPGIGTKMTVVLRRKE